MKSPALATARLGAWWVHEGDVLEIRSVDGKPHAFDITPIFVGLPE